MDYNKKYHKYKSKYINLKMMMCGGTLKDANEKLEYTGDKKAHDFTKDAVVVGEGGNGVIVRDSSCAIKLIKNISTCRSSIQEFHKHFNVYETFNSISKYIDTQEFKEIYDVSYIPKPLTFYDYKIPTKINISDKTYNISCLYSMEYMEPANIEDNLCEGVLIPVHIANISHKGCFGTRGYFLTSLIDLQETIEKLEVKYETPNVKKLLFKSQGFLFGCAWLGAGYNPKDFQFMLSIIKGKLHVVGFDFGMFEPYNFKSDYDFDGLYWDFSISMYMFIVLCEGTYEEVRNNVLDFLKGVAYVVRTIKAINPKDIRIEHFTNFVNKIHSDIFSISTNPTGTYNLKIYYDEDMKILSEIIQ